MTSATTARFAGLAGVLLLAGCASGGGAPTPNSRTTSVAAAN